MIYVILTFFLGADNNAEFGVKSNVENKKSFDVPFLCCLDTYMLFLVINVPNFSVIT